MIKYRNVYCVLRYSVKDIEPSPMLVCNESNFILSQYVSALYGRTSQHHASKASCELGGMREKGSLHFFKMKKLLYELSSTASTPHRNTLINTGRLEELKPPATSC